MLRRAYSLISGGLDSMLATKVILEQGIYVEGINFFTGFCVEGHTQAIRKKDKVKQKRNNALWVAEQLGISLHIIDVVEEYKNVVLNPKHGYGANLNPCLDCKIFMLSKANQMLKENHFDFVITGEVIGQRPKSQRKQCFPVIANESGIEDRLVRPLSAHYLPATLPEREGWVDRDQLLGFTGRNRKPQIDLAEKFGFKDYAQPAGGCCFLTNEHYSKKLQDLWKSKQKRDYDLDDILLLKVGRHLRPHAEFKLIIGREEGENNYLEGYRQQFINLKAVHVNGPIALFDGTPSAENMHLAAQIISRYGDGKHLDVVTVEIDVPNEGSSWLTVVPIKENQIEANWYI